jgi:hypothetical protein
MAGGGGASGGGGGGAASTAQLMGDAKAQVTDNIQQLSELSDRTYADIHAPLPYEDGAAAYGCRGGVPAASGAETMAVLSGAVILAESALRRLTRPACLPALDRCTGKRWSRLQVTLLRWLDSSGASEAAAARL